MFPFQRGDELVIQFSNSPHQQPQTKTPQDLILEDHAYLDVNDSDKKFSNTKPNKVLFYGADHENHGNNCNDQKKKMVHREIERQRRQEMATLYASLRSQLPLEFIKGKRSISDHMNEAVNYIKHMQNNIKQLGAKRDELKKKLSNSMLDENHHIEHSCSSFTVHESNGIVGIEISCDQEGLTLSKLLQSLLLEESLEVVSCLSTKVNDRLLHSLQCEVKNFNSVDLSELRRKLANVIPSLRCCD